MCAITAVKVFNNSSQMCSKRTVNVFKNSRTYKKQKKKGNNNLITSESTCRASVSAT